jgi:hypothetical protein
MVPFGLFRNPKNIIELFTFDLSTFFYEEDYEEVQSQEGDGVFMVEYEKILPWTEMGLFEKVQFRLFNDKTNIVGSSHINVTLPATQHLVEIEKVATLLNSLYNIYGWDDENRGTWNDNDVHDFLEKSLERQWTLGEGKYIYSVKVTCNQKYGLLLKILFFNHLLELIGKGKP